MNEHRYIENQDAESKAALRKKTEEKLGFSLTNVKADTKKTDKFKRYVTVFATAVAAICLIVAFPFILRQGLATTNGGALNEPNRSVGTFDYYRQKADCNIKEYNLKYDTSLLYLDLYDDAEEVSTYIYLSTRDESVLYFCETIFPNTNFSEIDLYIVDNSAALESFDWREGIAESQKGTVVRGVRVSWFSSFNAGTVVFRYGGYKYFVEISSSVGEEDVASIVESMLSGERE